jgi:hypothetical protein
MSRNAASEETHSNAVEQTAGSHSPAAAAHRERRAARTRPRQAGQAGLSSRSMRAAARYSVGVMPKRCLKTRFNGPIEP